MEAGKPSSEATPLVGGEDNGEGPAEGHATTTSVTSACTKPASSETDPDYEPFGDSDFPEEEHPFEEGELTNEISELYRDNTMQEIGLDLMEGIGNEEIHNLGRDLGSQDWFLQALEDQRRFFEGESSGASHSHTFQEANEAYDDDDGDDGDAPLKTTPKGDEGSAEGDLEGSAKGADGGSNFEEENEEEADIDTFLGVEWEEPVTKLDIAKSLDGHCREASIMSESEWVIESIIKRKRQRWVIWYRIKWRDVEEPSWESEESLRDDGMGRTIDQWEQEQRKKAQAAAEARAREGYGDRMLRWCVREEERQRQYQMQAHRFFLRQSAKARARFFLLANAEQKAELEAKLNEKDRLEKEKSRVPLGTFNPDNYWPDLLGRVKREFEMIGRLPLRIQNITQPKLAVRFSKEWTRASQGKPLPATSPTTIETRPDKTPQGTVPVMVFHGTHSAAVPSIIQNGLVIPGKGGNGVAVANGSAYGNGIYTALSTATPVGYSRGSPSCLFICAALVDEKTYKSNDWLIFFREEQVLPCYLLEWSYMPPGFMPPPVPLPIRVTNFYRPTSSWPPPAVDWADAASFTRIDRLRDTYSSTCPFTALCLNPPLISEQPAYKPKPEPLPKKKIRVETKEAPPRRVEDLPGPVATGGGKGGTKGGKVQFREVTPRQVKKSPNWMRDALVLRKEKRHSGKKKGRDSAE